MTGKRCRCDVHCVPPEIHQKVFIFPPRDHQVFTKRGVILKASGVRTPWLSALKTMATINQLIEVMEVIELAGIKHDDLNLSLLVSWIEVLNELREMTGKDQIKISESQLSALLDVLIDAPRP